MQYRSVIRAGCRQARQIAQCAGRRRSRTGSVLSATPSVNSRKGWLVLALRVTGCRTDIRRADETALRLRAFGLVHHGWEETGGCRWDLRAGHPAIAGGSVHHVQAVSSRAAPSPPSCRQAARSSAPTTPFTTVPGTQEALSRLGKGLELRKLVAGAGFEPATSGL
jgi:hypothetical protein